MKKTTMIPKIETMKAPFRAALILIALIIWTLCQGCRTFRRDPIYPPLYFETLEEMDSWIQGNVWIRETEKYEKYKHEHFDNPGRGASEDSHTPYWMGEPETGDAAAAGSSIDGP